MPAAATDSTLPPQGRNALKVCPRCRRPLEQERSADHSARLARCPEHGVAFVGAHDLAESDYDPLLGVTLAGRFTVLARLGKGSMGAVYRARQEPIGRDVALKIVRRDRAYDAETKARFEREARAISSLTSPHTVTAFDFGEAEDGSWFLAMEMLEGETLGERLRRQGRLDWLEAVHFAQGALRSLAEAHGKGIIHRDLKPDNLFLCRSSDMGGVDPEICKVLDFGISKWMRDDEVAQLDQLETLAGTVFGTPRYMSPEQAQGIPLDARSDLYSLGVLLYQMMSGRAPFVDDDAVVVMARHIKDSPPSFSDVAADLGVPSAIEKVVRRALAKVPADRPRSAEDFIAALDVALERSRGVTSGVRPRSLPVASEASRRAWKRATIAGALLIAFAVTCYFIAGRSSSPPRSSERTASSGPDVALSPQSSVSTQRAADALENSSQAPVASAAEVPSAVIQDARPTRRVVPAPAPTLPRKKANERYGRFE